MVAAVVLSASVAFAAPLSEKEWKQQGNAICEQINTELETAGDAAFAGLGEDGEPTEAQMQAFAAQFTQVINDGVASIQALEEPASFKKNVKKFAAAVKVVLTKIEADPTVIFNEKSDPFAKVDKVARKLGLKTCADDS